MGHGSSILSVKGVNFDEKKGPNKKKNKKQTDITPKQANWCHLTRAEA